MPMIVSNIRKHITTEFLRDLSFVLKRLETIAKYLTKLPLFLTFILYGLHLIRAGLRIFNYFYKSKNKNLGNTCKLLFAFFKVLIAVIALILLSCGLFSLPSMLLASFFAYTLLKLIHSGLVLFVSTISYLKIDKNNIEHQWRRTHYKNNIIKHVFILSTGLSFVLLTCLFNTGTTILIWSNPLLLLVDIIICAVFIAVSLYLGYKIAKNLKCANENPFLKTQEHVKIRKFLLLFGLGIVALMLTAAAPNIGVLAITLALILLCLQDIILTIYYHFYPVTIVDPDPANLEEAQLNASMLHNSRDYYQTLSPTLYLQTQISEKFQFVEAVNQANKKILLKVTFVKLLQLEAKLEKISKLDIVTRFVLQQKKLLIKKEYLLHELAWALNTSHREVLINLFILAIIDLPESIRSSLLEIKLFELLELLDFLGTEQRNIDYHHPQLNKNFLAQLFFMARQGEFSKEADLAKVKPKVFYQSFWKKVGACEALSHAFQTSRRIEHHLSLSHSS